MTPSEATPGPVSPTRSVMPIPTPNWQAAVSPAPGARMRLPRNATPVEPMAANATSRLSQGAWVRAMTRKPLTVTSSTWSMTRSARTLEPLNETGCRMMAPNGVDERSVRPSRLPWMLICSVYEPGHTMTVSPAWLAVTAAWMVDDACADPPQPPGPACPSLSTHLVVCDAALAGATAMASMAASSVLVEATQIDTR